MGNGTKMSIPPYFDVYMSISLFKSVVVRAIVVSCIGYTYELHGFWLVINTNTTKLCCSYTSTLPHAL